MSSIKEYCTTDVITAWEGESILEAVRRMDALKVGALVVVDDRMKPLGILTDRDVAIKVISQGKDPVSTRLEEVMSRHVATLKDSEGLMEASRIMANMGVRRLPVVNEQEKVVGILSLDDLLRVIESELNNLSTTISRNIS